MMYGPWRIAHDGSSTGAGRHAPITALQLSGSNLSCLAIGLRGVISLVYEGKSESCRGDRCARAGITMGWERSLWNFG